MVEFNRERYFNAIICVSSVNILWILASRISKITCFHTNSCYETLTVALGLLFFFIMKFIIFEQDSVIMLGCAIALVLIFSFIVAITYKLLLIEDYVICIWNFRSRF